MAWDDGDTEEFAPSGQKGIPGFWAVRRAHDDYTEMVRTARRHGIRIVFLGYPSPIPIFAPFTATMARVATQNAVDFVDAVAAVDRVPAERMTWTFGAHAGPAGLVEIARDVAATIRAAPAIGTANPPAS